MKVTSSTPEATTRDSSNSSRASKRANERVNERMSEGAGERATKPINPPTISGKRRNIDKGKLPTATMAGSQADILIRHFVLLFVRCPCCCCCCCYSWCCYCCCRSCSFYCCCRPGRKKRLWRFICRAVPRKSMANKEKVLGFEAFT